MGATQPAALRGLFCWLICAACGWFVCCFPASIRAATPESPEVKQLITKALNYLEKASDDRLGAKCLAGLAFLKDGRDEKHPQVVAAVAACREVCKSEPNEIASDIYSTGLAVIFLCELDPSLYRPEIAKFMQSLEHRQRKAGGWGYPHSEPGDTSMTQYAVLATWTSQRSGVEVSQDSVERVCNWLLRTQDPSGGFGYQANDPGVGNWNRIAQSDVRNSLGAAGSGSLYICADLLRFKVLPEFRRSGELPKALVLVDDVNDSSVKKPLTDRVPSKTLMKGISEANTWMTRNFKIDQGNWNLYHLYALERYHSFRELAENIKDKEPTWYNAGVQHLSKTQSENGTWESGCGVVPDTAFGALFLMRSTKKSIEKALKRFREGQLTGGRGLPTDVAEVTIKQGRVVNAAAMSAQIEDLVSLLEEGEGSGFEFLTNNPDEFKLAEDPKLRKEQLRRLRVLVNAKTYETRLVAVRALGRARDWDSVPALLTALSDPDARVVREADTGLRFIARRFGPSNFPLRLTPDDKQAAVQEWTKWYASLRPDAE